MSENNNELEREDDDITTQETESDTDNGTSTPEESAQLSKEERRKLKLEEYRRREMEREKAVLHQREKEEVRAAKHGDDGRHKAKKQDKPGFFKRIGKLIKDTFGELRYVTRPTRDTVIKSTAVVLVMAGIFTVIAMIMDSGLGWLYGWFTNRL